MCEWLEVVVQEVELPEPRGRERFWSVRPTYDYAAILAVTTDGRVPLVRQFRPAVDAEVLELPSGSVEPGEQPDAAVRRELLEETGCEAADLVPLGALLVDSGRLEARQWGFFASDVRVVREGPDTDEQLELLFVPVGELRGLVERGELMVAPHLAIVAAAAARRLIAL